LIALPVSVMPLLDGYTSSGDDLKSNSKAHVYYFRHPRRRGRYVKVYNSAESRAGEADLAAERSALQPLQGQSWVPDLVYYGKEGEIEYLISEELPGQNCISEPLQRDIPTLVKAMAQGLRRIHNLPVNDFPLDGSVDQLLAKLERLIRLDLVSAEALEDAGWQGSPQAFLDHMRRTRPQPEESVLTHGDYCLPNILVKEGQVTGIVDWGYAGMGDRHRDFAAVAMSIGWNLGEQWVEPFFEAYGMDALDREKLQYHRLLYDLL
jgi:aminoglycoside phosphotransferase